MENSFIQINDSSSLNHLVLLLNDKDFLALDKGIGLDTEFERRTTFFPKPALLQIQLKDNTYLIDPLACGNLDALFVVLSKHQILMHACREDLEVFRSMSQVRIQSFFDMQIAASLVGFDAQISYQNLVYELLGIELSKSETCSDWLQRPLSNKQILYAADDVIHLEKVHNILLKKLESLGRVHWFTQEMQFLKSLIAAPADDDYFFKINGLGKFNHHQLVAAYELILWRDNLARSKNIPRGFIIKDKGLLQIIKSVGYHEINNHLLHRLEDVPPPFIRRYSAEMCELLKQLKNAPLAEKAILKLVQDLPDTSKKLKNHLKTVRDQLSTKLSIKAEVLFSNRLLDQALDAIYFTFLPDSTEQELDECFNQILNPWRYELFKPELLLIRKEVLKSV